MSKKIYSVYDLPKRKGILFDEQSMTMQEFKDETDLNLVVDKNMNFKDPAYVTKLILAGKMSDKEPIYGDFTQVKDYQTSLNTVNLANEQFAMLPAKVRDRFHNNPLEMLAFVNDEKNVEEGIELGLFDRKLVNEDLRAKANISNGTNLNSVTPTSNGETAGVDTVSGSAPETSA